MTTSPGTDYVTKYDFDLAMARIDTRFAQIETLIERTAIMSIRWTVGIALGQYALLFGVILFFIARDVPHA